MQASSLLRSILDAPGGGTVVDWTEPGCAGKSFPVAPWHIHVACDKAWIVIEGRLVIRAGDEEIALDRGDALVVPHGTPHTYWNPDPAPCRYLLAMTETTRRLIEAIHATSDRSPATMRAIFEAHGARLV